MFFDELASKIYVWATRYRPIKYCFTGSLYDPCPHWSANRPMVPLLPRICRYHLVFFPNVFAQSRKTLGWKSGFSGNLESYLQPSFKSFQTSKRQNAPVFSLSKMQSHPSCSKRTGQNWNYLSEMPNRVCKENLICKNIWSQKSAWYFIMPIFIFRILEVFKKYGTKWCSNFVFLIFSYNCCKQIKTGNPPKSDTWFPHNLLSHIPEPTALLPESLLSRV